MLYTIEQLTAEYWEAVNNKRISERAHREAKDELDKITDKARGLSYEEYAEIMERAETVAAAERVDAAAAAYKVHSLYVRCILEMLQNAVREAVETTIYSHDFKGDGMPMHYKKWLKLATEKIPDNVARWADDYCVYFRLQNIDPVTGEYMACSVDLGEVWNHAKNYGGVHEVARYTGKPYTRAEDGATFAQVRRACMKTADARKKYADIMSAAQERADKLASDTAHGLHVLYFEIQGK